MSPRPIVKMLRAVIASDALVEQFLGYCTAIGAEPLDELADAVALFLDERERDIELEICSSPGLPLTTAPSAASGRAPAGALGEARPRPGCLGIGRPGGVDQPAGPP